MTALTGWSIAPGDTGVFPPAQIETVVEVIRQEPSTYGLARSRWRLTDLREVIPALTGYSLSGVSKLLHRHRVRLKRGRLRLHSPDLAYTVKTARIQRARELARTYPTRVTLLYGDEVSFYRQPTLADCWFPVGDEPTVPHSHRSNTRHRICGGLDAVTGQVVRLTGSRITIANLKRFLRQVRAATPDRYLFLVWDNWPVHRHPDVVAEARRLRIRLLWLPTYAPWLNPIEKLWRHLKQTVLHQHRLADRWDDLKQAVTAFLDRFIPPSPDLLRSVGLVPN